MDVGNGKPPSSVLLLLLLVLLLRVVDGSSLELDREDELEVDSDSVVDGPGMGITMVVPGRGKVIPPSSSVVVLEREDDSSVVDERVPVVSGAEVGRVVVEDSSPVVLV